MKETNWNDCINNNSARKISSDVKRADSLVETAKARTRLIKGINEKNGNFVFEDYYTSLLELLQAMTFRKGFNILNHICLGYYLRDIMKRDDLYSILAKLDWNSSNFNTRIPVTISVSRKVGSILSESSAQNIEPPPNYKYYM